MDCCRLEGESVDFMPKNYSSYVQISVEVSHSLRNRTPGKGPIQENVRRARGRIWPTSDGSLYGKNCGSITGEDIADIETVLSHPRARCHYKSADHYPENFRRGRLI